jgi:anthranilate/para-aminobenzoate synthase component I
LRLAGVSLLSSSPEVFLRVTADGRAITMPIKGTRRRGRDQSEDENLAAELRASAKEQAENLMIVDLMRNDLSRVAVTGTVAAHDLLQVHSLPHVHQLVSTVSAQVRPELTALDVIEAAFPAGSMTGAPKIAAIGILAELERGPRGIYSGAFGWLGRDGTCELAMVIRSIIIDDAGATIGTGGGITSDSDSAFELEETRIKAAAALRALGA